MLAHTTSFRQHFNFTYFFLFWLLLYHSAHNKDFPLNFVIVPRHITFCTFSFVTFRFERINKHITRTKGMKEKKSVNSRNRKGMKNCTTQSIVACKFHHFILVVTRYFSDTAIIMLLCYSSFCYAVSLLLFIVMEQNV